MSRTKRMRVDEEPAPSWSCLVEVEPWSENARARRGTTACSSATAVALVSLVASF